MSAAPTPATTKPALKVTQVRVLHSEFTKFRSLRSTVWTLLIAVVVTIGLGALISAATASQHHTSASVTQPAATSLVGVIFAVIAFGVLGVLFISGEYSTGMIRSSLTAVPRRLPVLWAKLATFAGVVFITALAASLISFFLGQALLNTHHLGVSISSPGALRSVAGAALYVTVAGAIGLALGALFRNTAAAIATFAGVFFVLPLLTNLLPAPVSGHLAQYLPSNAGGALWGGTMGLRAGLPPWTGFALLGGYAAVLITAAAWRLRHADA